MSTTNPEPLAVHRSQWQAGDAQQLRDFITRNPAFLPALASRAPVIETGSVEKAALSGARHAGYEDLFRAIASMADNDGNNENSPFIENEA